MLELALTVAGSTAVLIWCYLLLGRGGFWRVGQLPGILPPDPSSNVSASENVALVSAPVGPIFATPGASAAGNLNGQLAVIIPARNEAETVARSIESWLKQSGSHPIHIFLVDDGSSDGTATIARTAAAALGMGNKLTVITGKPLPAGWLGKPWALMQGVEQARELHPRFLLLTDADIAHAPEDVARLLAIATAGGYDLASLMVRLHCRSLAERLLIPPFVFFFFMLYPPEWTADAKRASAAAAGGCVLVRPEALDRAGGIAAIRDQVIDDCSLAQTVKCCGGRVWLGLAGSSASLRPYHSFGEIERMIARTAFNQLRHSFWTLLLAVVGMAFTYVLPIALLFTGHTMPLVLGLASWALMTITFLPMVRYYKLPPVWALSLPLAALFYTCATVHSALKYWQGHGGEWKGRVQDPR
jgi:hopene-associated glycosyltransferase HpnB